MTHRIIIISSSTETVESEVKLTPDHDTSNKDISESVCDVLDKLESIESDQDASGH